jgi:hypothetical protein
MGVFFADGVPPCVLQKSGKIIDWEKVAKHPFLKSAEEPENK